MSRSPTTITARQKSRRPLALPREEAAPPRPLSYCRSLAPIPPPAPRSPRELTNYLLRGPKSSVVGAQIPEYSPRLLPSFGPLATLTGQASSAAARSHIQAAGFIAGHTHSAHLTPIPPPAPRSPRAAASHHLTMELSASDITWLTEAEDDLRDTAVFRPSAFRRAPTASERQREAAIALSAMRTIGSAMGRLRGLGLRANLANKSVSF